MSLDSDDEQHNTQDIDRMLEDRRVLGAQGLFIIVVVTDPFTGQLVKTPRAVVRGMLDHPDLVNPTLVVVEQEVLAFANEFGEDANGLRDLIEEAVSQRLKELYGLYPLVQAVVTHTGDAFKALGTP
jgi:mRNA degradation ribonuclease J1/J2